MKKYIIILLSILLLVGIIAKAQNPIRRNQKPKTEKVKTEKTKTEKTKSKPQMQDGNNSTKKKKPQKTETSSRSHSSSSRSNSTASSQSAQTDTYPAMPTSYKVTFYCNVPDADMYIDGKDYGHPKGTHSLHTGSYQVKLVAEGYDDYTTNIQVNAGSTKFDFRMTKTRYEDVAFTCNVQNAQLFVDGHYLGNANGKYQITASNHLIRVKSEGYQERIIYFDASSTNNLDIELSPN